MAPQKNGMVAGWGSVQRHWSSQSSMPDALHAVCLPVVSHNVCVDAYKSKYRVTSNMLCAGHRLGGQDSCNGDSGGGYVFEDVHTKSWVLGGVVSWGSDSGCGQADKYGVYVKMANYLLWIREKMVWEGWQEKKNVPLIIMSVLVEASSVVFRVRYISSLSC